MKIAYLPQAIRDLRSRSTYLKPRSLQGPECPRRHSHFALPALHLSPGWRAAEHSGRPQIITRKYPYLIYYTIDQGTDEILVITINMPGKIVSSPTSDEPMPICNEKPISQRRAHGRGVADRRGRMGSRWSVDVAISRQNRRAMVRTIWMVWVGEDFLRFVTLLGAVMAAEIKEDADAASLLGAVALVSNLPERGLLRGQVGAIVEKLDDATVLVEFSDDQGRALRDRALSEGRPARVADDASGGLKGPRSGAASQEGRRIGHEVSSRIYYRQSMRSDF